MTSEPTAPNADVRPLRPMWDWGHRASDLRSSDSTSTGPQAGSQPLDVHDYRYVNSTPSRAGKSLERGELKALAEERRSDPRSVGSLIAIQRRTRKNTSTRARSSWLLPVRQRYVLTMRCWLPAGSVSELLNQWRFIETTQEL